MVDELTFANHFFVEVWQFVNHILFFRIPGTTMLWGIFIVVLWVLEIIGISIRNASRGDK